MDSETSSPYNPQMQVKAVSCKEEAICEHDPEMLLSSVGQSLSEMENCSVVRLIKISNSIWMPCPADQRRRGTIHLVIS